jgi:hypothetical protein
VFPLVIAALVSRGQDDVIPGSEKAASLIDTLAYKTGTITRLRTFTQDQGN